MAESWRRLPWRADGAYVMGSPGVVATCQDVRDAPLLAAAPEMLALLREWSGALDREEPSLVARTRALVARVAATPPRKETPR